MPNEYSYNDFMQMQQQAIDRVREMQKKAAPNEKASAEPIHRVFAPENNSQPKPSVSALPKHNPQPRSNQKTQPKPPDFMPNSKKKPDSERPSKPSKKPNPLAFLSNMDSDMSLILPLLLLLGKEGADNILLLALLYIIS